MTVALLANQKPGFSQEENICRQEACTSQGTRASAEILLSPSRNGPSSLSTQGSGRKWKSRRRRVGPSRALFLLWAGDSHSKQTQQPNPGAQDRAGTKRALAEAPSIASKDLPGNHISHLLATPLLWDSFKYNIVIFRDLWPARHRGVLLEVVRTPISSGLLPPCLPQGLPWSVI